MDMYTLLYLKWITKKKLLYSIWNSAQYNVAAWMTGVWERMDVCIYMAESLLCSPETITMLLTSYILIQNRKLKKTYNLKIKRKKNSSEMQFYYTGNQLLHSMLTKSETLNFGLDQ